MHNRFMKFGVLSAVLLTQSVFVAVEAKEPTPVASNVVYPLVKLEQGVTQLCDDTQRNGPVCISPAMPTALRAIRQIIQTDALGDAPYAWIAVGKKFAYACAAGTNPQVEVKCVKIKTDLSRFNVEKAENKILSFAFSAKQSNTSLDQVGAVATQFVTEYGQAEGYLLAYSRDNWGKAKSNNVSAASAKAAVGKDTGYSTQEYEGDDDEGGGGDSGGGAGDSGGGGGDSGGGDSGGGSGEGGDGKNIDPSTGEPPKVVVTGPLPPPKWPSNPTPCNVLGIFCNGSGNGTENPDSPSHEENKAYCDAQRQAAYNHCTSVYATNKNNLPGSGSDYPARYRICVREYLAGTGCHDY